MLNHSKTFVILFSLFIFKVDETLCQLNPYNEASIASPNAASLGKYGDIPVSYHTGIPQMSIPIYQITEGSLSLPVSLSYHASGLRVAETASWVGAGWSLNAGGVITRTVRGAPDERFTSTVYAQTKGYFSDYGYTSYYMIPGDTVTYDSPAFQSGKKDGEPDLFTFNFGNYTGKFYFRDDRTPVFEPAQDIKVEYLYTGYGSIQSFIMTSPDGLKYYFGKTAATGDTDPVEITNPVTVQSGYLAGTSISSWYLNKIKSADNVGSISLMYLPENYSYYSNSMFPVSYDNGITSAMNFRPTNYEYNLIKNIVSGVRLSSITFSNGKVDFIGTNNRTDLGDASLAFTPEAVNTQSKRLDSIKISDNNNNFCKKFTLYYNYFVDNTALQGYFAGYGITTDSKRLRLDSIQEKSCDNSIIIPPYKFNYFSETVPRRLSFGQDYWGFYNGITNNTKLIPTYTENEFTVFPGANRRPNWPAMRGGALQKITYPTGGNTTLNFEANDTYASTQRYNSVSAFSPYIGFGYTGISKTESHILTANPYTISFSNTTTGLTGYLEIRDGSGNLAFSLSSTAGQTNQQTIKLSPGTYSIIISSTSQPPGGTGIQASFSELVPYIYSRNEMVGGLRIKQITNTSANSPDVITNYSYLDYNNHSTGVLYNRPVFVQALRSDEWVEAGDGGPFSTRPNGLNYCSINGCFSCDNIGGNLVYYKSPVGIRPMSTSQGNHIGYNEVKVSEVNNGFKIYRYYGPSRWDTNTGEIADTDVITKPPCSLSIPNYPEAPLQFDPVRGELQYEGYFDPSGKLLKGIDYYIDTAQDKVKTPGSIWFSRPGNNQVNTYYDLTAFRIKYRKSIEFNYGISTGTFTTITNETYFASSYHNQPSKKIVYTSIGDSLITRIKYTADFRTTCDTISDCSSNYFSSANAINTTWAQAKITCPTMGCRWNSYQKYRRDLAANRAAYVACRRTNYTDSASRFNTNFLTIKNAADTDLKPILELQLANTIPPIEISEWKNLNLTSASYTKYDYSTNPATSVYPKIIRKINLQAPTTTFLVSTNTNTTVTKDSRYADESTITFLNGNLTELMHHDSITNTYIWDYFNTQPIAKVTNALNSQSAHTSFEADGKGNWTFTGAPIVDATSPTGKKCYSLASGSVSKSSLTISSRYIVSYWSKTGAAFTVSGNTGVVQGKTINGWAFFEHTVTGVSAITVSGTGNIDELRLYPSNAQMTTYTYTPLLGMTSTCDADNRITYYYYDILGRLRWIKDQDGNIIKTIEYHYKNQPGN